MTKIGYNNGNPTRIPIRRVNCGFYIRWYYNGWHYWNFLQGTSSEVTDGEKYRTTGTNLISFSSGQITQDQVRAIRTLMNAKEVQVLMKAGWANCKINPASLKIYDRNINGYEIEFSASIGSREVARIPAVIPITPPTPDPDICGMVIGTQTWMCKNYDSHYPGSKVYGNDEANRALFGGLYTWNQIMASGFCPIGWHVPTVAEWKTLIDYVGGGSVAGGKLKEAGTTYWTTDAGTNDYGFGARGGGYFFDGVFAELLATGYYWTADEYPTEGELFAANVMYFRYNSSVLLDTGYEALKTMFASVRLIKDAPPPPKLGFLYNWHSVNTGLLVPVGCHVPSAAEFQTLCDYLGGASVAGGHLREIGTTHWQSPNTGADNSSGFNALPTGQRLASNGSFSGFSVEALFHSSDAYVNGVICGLNLHYDDTYGGGMYPGSDIPLFNKEGFSIRPIKDSTTLTDGQTGIVTDIDGNDYTTICIGTQEWFASNLKVTRLNNGTLIPEITDNTEWTGLTIAARCAYNNDHSNI